jgi:hypothetical protein
MRTTGYGVVARESAVSNKGGRESGGRGKVPRARVRVTSSKSSDGTTKEITGRRAPPPMPKENSVPILGANSLL